MPVRAIEASLERAPDNPALHTFAATVAYQMDRLEPAMDHANIALRSIPSAATPASSLRPPSTFVSPAPTLQRGGTSVVRRCD